MRLHARDLSFCQQTKVIVITYNYYLINFIESNMEMKEENQMLREQDVIRNELLSRYEKRNDDMTKEVSVKSSNLFVQSVEIMRMVMRS